MNGLETIGVKGELIMEIQLDKTIGIQKVLNDMKDKKIPIRTAYKMAQFSEELDKKVHFFEDKMKQIIERYSEKTEEGTPKVLEDGKSIQIKSDCIEQCQKEIFELSTLLIDINEYEFTLEELDKLELSIEDLKNLMPFIKDKE